MGGEYRSTFTMNNFTPEDKQAWEKGAEEKNTRRAQQNTTIVLNYSDYSIQHEYSSVMNGMNFWYPSKSSPCPVLSCLLCCQQCARGDPATPGEQDPKGTQGSAVTSTLHPAKAEHTSRSGAAVITQEWYDLYDKHFPSIGSAWCCGHKHPHILDLLSGAAFGKKLSKIPKQQFNILLSTL